ncbi:MAG: hypothetical protein CBC72_003035 [Gammaproteobacteria bacterium TMED112]|nr:MAG: hypothetical protein CBC72_003035 [Gammaproteobacteria bacterium TMED112]|tara:strand:+ start:38701 stop:39102 length:402 start_codon:yes stop_codon:yes gene_type:complete
MKYLLLLTALLSFNEISASGSGLERAAWVAEMKLDLAKLKGPLLVADLEAKRENRISDLDLLINSGKYEGKQLERLFSMREKVLNTELPSQDQINLRHEKKIKKLDRILKDPMMRDRKRLEQRKRKNRRTKRN